MATYKKTKATTETVTARLPIADNAALTVEAERQGSNRSRILCKALSHYLEKQSIESRLAQLENRLTRRMFEIVSAVAGLSEEDRKQAMREAKQHLREVA
jgi:hypothetical protein